MKNKKGWIKIVEAFLSILLVASVLMVVINKGYIGKGEISSKIYDAEVSILREIELDDSLRAEILTAGGDPFEPIKWDEFDSGLPNVKSRIESRRPNYLKCKAKVCELDKVCSLEEYIDKDVYAQSVPITATFEIYNPRQLKLFCWIG